MSQFIEEKNVFETHRKRWSREITLKEAFAKSVNTVFGKIGWFYLGYPTLKEYSERFGFNVKLDTEIPIDMSTSEFEDESWEIASAASGYTRGNQMSPIHGALIASVAANKGKMMSPALIRSIKIENEMNNFFEFQPHVQNEVVSPSTAEQLKILMRKTVTGGTTKKIFRTFLSNKKNQDIDIGGKSGSLTGLHPKGKYDWFIGYFTYEGKTISLAALTINEKYWTVKSAYLVRRFIEYYLEDIREKNTSIHYTTSTTADGGVKK